MSASAARAKSFSVIPPSLCVLAAAYIDRQQLNESQMSAIRYLTSITIYVSSTADIFINGVADAPWLPVVLAGLAAVEPFVESARARFASRCRSSRRSRSCWTRRRCHACRDA